MIRTTAAISTARILTFVLRKLGRGGTTLPGRVALRIDPQLPDKLRRSLKVYMVTGTNGKTTTTKMIGTMLNAAGISFFTNQSGANLASGLTAALISNATLSGRPRKKVALLEVDEAAFRVMAGKLTPDILVVTNFFRDQLDRYGELYSTLGFVREGLQKSPLTKLILNGDDSLTASLSKQLTNPTEFYGFEPEAFAGKRDSANSDARFCLFCKTEYTYTFHTYGHLGGFSCPSCGYRHPELSVTCSQIDSQTSDTSHFSVRWSDGRQEFVSLGLPGLYNIYNALAAITLAGRLDALSTESLTALTNMESGFGRMESFDANGRRMQVILVKNPTGFNQVLQYLQTAPPGSSVGLMINDRAADGTDISWLWDVDFEQLTSLPPDIVFFVSGDRAADIALRLHYAGLPAERIHTEEDQMRLINQLVNAAPSGGRVFLLPTYTAMLEIRARLQQLYGLKEFWK